MAEYQYDQYEMTKKNHFIIRKITSKLLSTTINFLLISID